MASACKPAKGAIPTSAYWEERAGRLVAEERCRGLERVIEELRSRLAALEKPVVTMPWIQPAGGSGSPYPALPQVWVGDPPSIFPNTASTGGGFAVTGPAAIASATPEPTTELAPELKSILWLSPPTTEQDPE